MKKPDITAGEWTATEPEQRSDMGFGFDHMGGFQQRILAPVTSDIGTVGSMTIAETHDSEANAQAIAALPQCLAALETLLARTGGMDISATHDGLQNCEAIAKARSALLAAGYTE